jgi:ketosteroid isomerase-like protein
MPMLRCAVVLLLLGVAAPSDGGQSSAPASLQEADRAFATALTDHDRAAFVALLAPDAESTLPSLRRGPEAIANAWLPFLIDRGTTMILTTTEVISAPGSDTGTSSGTFAIRGGTANGIQTVPGGKYSLGWRLIDGDWKITAISGGGREAAPAASGDAKEAAPAAGSGGVGPFKFGMTRDEVVRVRECQPYTRVAITGGLECPHFQFDGREMNISFLFAGDRLRRIQLWYYEGESSADARAAVGSMLTYLQQTAGSITATARPELPLSEDAILTALNRAPAPRAGEIVHVELCGPRGGPEYWFGRVGRHAHGYMVMLFAEASTHLATR